MNRIKLKKILSISLIISILFSLLWVIVLNIFHFNEVKEYQTTFEIVNFIAMFSLLILSVIEISSLFFDKTAVISTAVSTVAIFLLGLFSFDFLLTANNYVNFGDSTYHLLERIFSPLNVVFTAVAFASFIYFFTKTYSINISLMEKRIIFIVVVIDIISYIITYIFNFEIYAVIALGMVGLYLLIRVNYEAFKYDKYDVPFLFTDFVSSLLIFLLIINALSFNKRLLVNAFGLTGAMLLAIDIIYILVYLDFTLRTSKEAYKKLEFENKVKELQTNVLKNQINSHFIFNTLNIIKNLYNEDVNKGNRALDLFSKHLRAYLEGDQIYTVSLSKELEVVDLYVELENMKGNKFYQIIYDIDVYDFDVPYFSIEPLIENVIKYSHIEDKEDGYISIITSEDDEYYYLTVSDNGVGFDIKNIKSTSHGLANAKERFKLIVNGDLSIESEIDKGTNIKIKIPRGESK